MEIHPVGAELFHTNGRTDMTKLIFRNYANAPKKCNNDGYPTIIPNSSIIFTSVKEELRHNGLKICW
jgi:hypothetical protein